MIDRTGTKGLGYNVFSKEKGIFIWSQDTNDIEYPDEWGITQVPLPDDGMNHAFDAANNVWKSYSSEEWAAFLSAGDNGGDTVGQSISDLVRQLATAQLSQAKINATLVKQNATMAQQIADLQNKQGAMN